MRAETRLGIRAVCAFAVITIAPMVQLGRAEVIFESATLGPTRQYSGWGIDSTWFMGSRFYVDRPVAVTSIGGHLLEWGGGNFFGAIVYLSSWSGLPLGRPFSAGEVAAWTVFDPGSPSSDFRTPLSVALTPGYYALIFGSGEFGAYNGEGAMPYQGQTDLPGASYILWDGWNWWDSSSGQARFVVEGTYSDYCGASGSNVDEFDYIGGVRFGSIDNWGTGNSHYGDYTSISTTIVPNADYTLVVNVRDGDEYTKCGAWIDWNQNNDFTDPGEQLTVSDISAETCTATVRLPEGAVAGDTRMRIRVMWKGGLLSCGHTDYGEVEDYTVTVGPAGPRTRIYGKKWHDLNDNGQMDGGEPALSGWSIFLDENYNGEIDPNDIVTTTDIDGNYEFTGMEPDVYYHVSEADRAGWINTYPGAGGTHYGIRMEEDDDIELNFGNYQLHNGDIKGYKFHDINNNGAWDAGEEPLSGWEIYIDESENGQWDPGEPKTTTNASGYYEFTNRQPGYYNVMEVPQAGWLQTYPGPTSGRLWGLEGRSLEPSTIAEVNLATMTIENRFVAPYNWSIIGLGLLATGPSTLFYCPYKYVDFETVQSLFFEIDSETGSVINQGVLEMPENEIAWNCVWHNGIFYVISVVTPIPSGELPVTYLNRYDPFTMELISRDLLVDIDCDSLAGDPYEDLLLCNLFINRSLYEIDPHTANVVGTIGQNRAAGLSMAYTNGVLYKTFTQYRDDIHTFHREDGSLISTQQLTGHENFDTIAGGIGVKGGHRVWIGKRDVEANFGGRLNSDGALSGTKYEDLNGNCERDANEPGMADWTIYVDLDGDMHPDAEEPSTVTDANGNWVINGLARGRYFVREIQKKGFYRTEPALDWIDPLDVNGPRDVVFDDVRNLLYVSTEAGEIERFDLSTNQFLSPIIVGGSPHGMDITADYGALYVADTQLSFGNGVVHKVNLNTLKVTNLIYTAEGSEDGSYDIAIGAQGLALFTGSSGGSIQIPLYVLDTATDIITTHPNVMGTDKVRDDLRLIRSYDRSTILLIGNSSDGWVAVYDAPSNSFISENRFSNYLSSSPIALNHDGSLAAIQLDEHCRIVDSNFDMVMGLDDSRMGAEFDPSSHLYYQGHSRWNTVLAMDTTAWELTDHARTGFLTETYVRFARGETAITADGRVLAVTKSDGVVLLRREYYTAAFPGRTISGLDFGSKAMLCGDINRDGDVDYLDVDCLSKDWLCSEMSMDVAPAVRDYVVTMPDFARFADAWGSQKGDANWDVLCDVAPVGGDGSVDFEDLKVLTGEWLLEGVMYDSDVTGADGPDGYVNLQDFACLAENWRDVEHTMDYDENFETGDLSNLSWVHAGYAPWTIDSSIRFEGDYGAKSADMPRYEDSILSVTATCGDGYVYFMLKSGTGGEFQFSVDGWPVFDWDEDLDWSLLAIPITAGTHTFEWSYVTNSYGEDNAWIDAIRFPPAND